MIAYCHGTPPIRTFCRAPVLLLALGVLPMAELIGAERLQITFDPALRQIAIRATGLEESGYELEIETPGLRNVELGRDTNEPGIIYLPPRDGPARLTEKPAIPPDAENVFFFHDLKAADGWELLARFCNGAGTWKLNGRFSPRGGALAPEVRIAVGDLEAGENLLHLRMPSPEVPRLVYHRRLPAGAEFAANVQTGHADWSGRVALYKGAGEARTIIASADVAGLPAATAPREIAAEWWHDRAASVEAVRAVAANILHAQIGPGSMFEGGFNLVYDTQRKSYRIPHWIWAWGPTIAFLLQSEQHPLARDAAAAPAWRAAALAAARRSLAFGVTDPKHLAAGVSTVRWEPSRAVLNGWVEYISTADSLFLAGWGWMSAYRETGDRVFLERTQSLVAAAERLMGQYPVVPQDWVVQRDRWTPHTLDESVFGMIGFRELHAATRAPEAARAGRQFLDSHLRHMSRGSGLLERAWLREEDRPIWGPDIKGHAWVVEGYLDAYQLSGDEKYLQLAHTLARQVIDCQHEDGAWTYLFKKPGPDDPRDDKGTAIWAYFFYELHRATKDPAYLAAARRAVAWCLRHQARGDDPHLAGGILNTNGMAYVRRRPLTILYSTTFLGLALLQELALPEHENER